MPISFSLCVKTENFMWGLYFLLICVYFPSAAVLGGLHWQNKTHSFIVVWDRQATWSQQEVKSQAPPAALTHPPHSPHLSLPPSRSRHPNLQSVWMIIGLRSSSVQQFQIHRTKMSRSFPVPSKINFTYTIPVFLCTFVHPPV